MIQFQSVTKRYQGTQRPALADLSLQINRGEFVFLVGASGSGKSSCLQLILRAEKPTKGSVNVLGQNLGTISSRKVPYFRRNLGVVFQDFRLLTNKTVYDNVAFALQVIGKSSGFIQEAVPDTLDMVGLGNKAKRMPNELSGGEQQRVAIARAIVNKPAILLADEPTGNLDPGTSLGILQLLERINAGGTTVVMATHEAGFVNQMQHRVVELSEGILVRDEVGGGYGETASIPRLPGSTPLRAPTLPSVQPAAAPGETGSQPSVAPAAPVPAARETGPAVPVAPAAASAPAGPEAAPAEEHSDPTRPVPVQQAAGADRSVPDRSATDSYDVGEAVRQAMARQTAQEPDERRNDTGSIRARFQTGPIDLPGDVAVGPGLAGRLGLGKTASGEDDEQQDVGPVQ